MRDNAMDTTATESARDYVTMTIADQVFGIFLALFLDHLQTGQLRTGLAIRVGPYHAALHHYFREEVVVRLRRCVRHFRFSLGGAQCAHHCRSSSRWKTGSEPRRRRVMKYAQARRTSSGALRYFAVASGAESCFGSLGCG